MLRLISTLTATIAVSLTSLGAVAAQERGDQCTDPESDFGDAPFLCGQIGATVATDADAAIDEILDRSAPDASVAHEAEAPDGSEVGYILEVPVGDEWANVQALRDDPDVTDASLVGSGETTVPDTAVATPAPAGTPLLALGVLAVSLSLLATARAAARRS